MKARGRPIGGNSEETRRLLIRVATQQFATRGYASTTLTSVAREANVATSALYHYFKGKEDLFESVYREIAPFAWDEVMDRVTEQTNARDALEIFLRRRTGSPVPYASLFLATLPSVAIVHPEFAHLLQQRTAYQDRLFGHIVDLAHHNGELRRFSRSEAVDVIRSLVMGYLFERLFAGDQSDVKAGLIIEAFEMLCNDSEVAKQRN